MTIESSFPKIYEVQGDTLYVDEEVYDALNQLAGRFYQTFGYIALEGHDYATSSHPQERQMFQMALEAAYMQRTTGAFD